MRSTTKSIMTVVSVGLLAASAKYGIESYALASQSNIDVKANTSAAQENAQNTPSAPAPSPSQSASAAPRQTTAPAPTKTTTPKKPSTASSQNSGSTSGTTDTSGSSSGTTTNPGTGAVAPSVVTKDGSAVQSGFGLVQVSVTKTDGKITSITMLKAQYTRGPSNLFDTLISAAISAQGSNFGNYSRVTYSTNAFKSSLETALAKF